MSKHENQPWVSGAAEILEHGLRLLGEDNSTNRRLALIAIDNAVELSIKTYLGLPKRVTGISVPRKRLGEISESFPSLLDALEEFGSDRLAGVDLASVEWYHRLRNQLYHQGYGLSVEREKVEVYAELAISLFKNLYGTSIVVEKSEDASLLGRFVQLWPRLEFALASIAADHSLLGRPRGLVTDVLRFLRNGNILPEAELKQVERFRRVRNEVVHGVTDYRTALDKPLVDEFDRLVRGLESVAGLADAGRG